MAMKLGEKAELVCQSDFAYGDSGSPPKIPPKATLVFTVTLKWMDIQMTDEELFAQANKQKTLGNDKFKAKVYEEAIELYNEAIESLDKMKSWDDNEDMKKLRISCLQNASVCLNSIGHFGQTVDKCTKVIQIDKNAVKAFFLRSVAHTKLQNFDDALNDIKEAIKLSPQDKKFR
jgi:peptidylprolyl isomerase